MYIYSRHDIVLLFVTSTDSLEKRWTVFVNKYLSSLYRHHSDHIILKHLRVTHVLSSHDDWHIYYIIDLATLEQKACEIISSS